MPKKTPKIDKEIEKEIYRLVDVYFEVAKKEVAKDLLTDNSLPLKQKAERDYSILLVKRTIEDCSKRCRQAIKHIINLY